MKKGLGIFLAVLLILLLGIAVNLFLIGVPVDGSTVICDVEEWENQVNIYVTTAESAIGFTDFRLRQEETTLYITFRKVMASPLHDGEQSIFIEKCDLTQIVLGGELIWSAH